MSSPTKSSPLVQSVTCSLVATHGVFCLDTVRRRFESISSLQHLCQLEKRCYDPRGTYFRIVTMAHKDKILEELMKTRDVVKANYKRELERIHEETIAELDAIERRVVAELQELAWRRRRRMNIGLVMYLAVGTAAMAALVKSDRRLLLHLLTQWKAQ